MQTPCPLCSPVQPGFILTFPNQTLRKKMETIFPEILLNRSCKIMNTSSLWVTEALFYSTIPFFEEFSSPIDWIIQRAALLPNGEWSYAEFISWDELLASRHTLSIRSMIAEDKIRMMVQPIVHYSKLHAEQMDAPSIIGYEMLARGIQKTHSEVISPSALFSAASAQNELFLLDRACRVEAMKTAPQLQHEALIFVNFIPTSIYVAEHCLQTTLLAAEKYGIAAKRIVFEVVETEHVEDIGHLKHILKFYRDHGFLYALDDVGSGFNTVEMLELEPDIVKLDRTLVSNIQNEAEKQRVAAEILQKCRDIGAKPLAEGIETAEEANWLGDLGYIWQQGYYYGKPDWPN